MVIGDGLEAIGNPQWRHLIEGGSENLEADRESANRTTAGLPSPASHQRDGLRRSVSRLGLCAQLDHDSMLVVDDDSSGLVTCLSVCHKLSKYGVDVIEL